MRPIQVVILAGDSEDHKISPGKTIRNKAFLTLNGRKMIDYVLDCYLNMEEVTDIAVAGPPDGLRGLVGVTPIPQREDMIENVQAGAALFPDGWLLLSTSDIPLITPEAIRDFLGRCSEADLFYPLIEKYDCQRRYPEMERTWVRLAEGEFTGGNVILVRAASIAAAAPAAAMFFAARKSPIQLARIIGPATLAKLLLRRLSIPELEAKVANILGLVCKAVITPYPEIGADIDKKSDYEIISRQIEMAKQEDNR